MLIDCVPCGRDGFVVGTPFSNVRATREEAWVEVEVEKVDEVATVDMIEYELR